MKPDSFTLDGKEYKIADLNQNAQLMVSHLHDLERKLGSMRFNLEQMQVGKEAFLTMLRSQIEVQDGSK
jgi:hypothetical protein